MTEANRATAILVTGGAGYIGSHICHALIESGYRPIVVDDLSYGFEKLVPEQSEFYRADIRDTAHLADIMEQHDVKGVIHMAAYIIEPASVEDPLSYYRNNVDGTISVLQACEMTGVDKFVFSSTCSIYGTVGEEPIDESCPIAPETPYGESKAMAEMVIDRTSDLKELNAVKLRYFNVAGSDPDLRCGLCSPYSQHLFTKVSQAATGEIEQFKIFGSDYDTKDGTAVRDYIHVSDLADIHIKALQYLFDGGETVALNCGYGKGYSVREIAEGMLDISDRKFEIVDAPRRPGDRGATVANPEKMKQLFDWTPQYDDINLILESSLAWRRKLASFLENSSKQVQNG